jgi:hypothetical protein
VAVSAITAPLAKYVTSSTAFQSFAGAFGATHSFGNDLVTNFTQSIITAAVNQAVRRETSIDWGNLSINAFAQTVAGTIQGQMSPESRQQNPWDAQQQRYVPQVTATAPVVRVPSAVDTTAVAAVQAPDLNGVDAELTLSQTMALLENGGQTALAVMRDWEVPKYASLAGGSAIPTSRDFEQSDFLRKLGLEDSLTALKEVKQTLGRWIDDTNATTKAFEDYFTKIGNDPNNNSLVRNAGQALAVIVSNTIGKGGMLNPLELAQQMVSVPEYGIETKSALDALEKLGGIDPSFARKEVSFLIKTQAKFADEATDFLANRFKLGKILDKLPLGVESFKGTVGELLTEGALRISGLFTEVSGSLSDHNQWGIKNSSDNGIDIVAKVKYGLYAGKWYGYEVKTTGGSSPLALNVDQKKGANIFMSERIKALADGGWLYTPGRVSAGDRAMANKILDDQGKTGYRGDVVQITNFGNKNVQVNITPWAPYTSPLPPAVPGPRRRW